MARDLPAHADEQAVRAAVGGLGPAIELADVEFAPNDIEAILAANIYQRHVIVGAPDSRFAGAKLDGLTGRVMRNELETVIVTDLESNTGRIFDIVRNVANVLGAFGETLRAGEIIIAGSVIPPMFVESTDDSVAFALDPTGAVSVQFG